MSYADARVVAITGARNFLGTELIKRLEEERRALAVQSRRYMDPSEAADLGRLDAAAIDRVRQEAWPEPRTADELHDALVVLGFVTETEGQRGNSETAGADLDFGWQHLFDQLSQDSRATVLDTGSAKLWVAAERLHEFGLVNDPPDIEPVIASVQTDPAPIETHEEAVRELVRSPLEGLGPIVAQRLAEQ